MFIKQGPFRLYHPASATARPLVGISACLAGEPVRYDGAHKQLTKLEQLQAQLELFQVCPESLAGLGTPREPVQLDMSAEGLRAVGRDEPALDVTEPLLRQRSHYLRELRGQPLCGFILKSRSPSCGFASTPVFVDGHPAYLDNGLFTDGLLRLYPWLAICEENQLESGDSLAAFTALCRLVQDILFTDPTTPLAELHAHYAAELGSRPGFPTDELRSRVDEDDRKGYVQVLTETARYNPRDW